MDSSSLIASSAWVIPIIVAVTFHEASHGWMAKRFGDDTAHKLGRVTFNPIKHIDPVGTILIPGLLLLTHAPTLFGYAKPVPVDFRKLKPLRFGSLAVAIAGPGMNVLLAIVCAILLHLGNDVTLEMMPWWKLCLFYGLQINCVLAVFNMLPILPLDGGRVLRALLPGNIGNLYAQTERVGMLIVIGLLMIPAMLKMHFMTNLLLAMDNWLLSAVLAITGHR